MRTDELFAYVCFLTLMQNGDGLVDKSPDYIIEKVVLLSCGYDAFAHLDVHNQEIVLAWYREWGKEIPSVIEEEHERQVSAGQKLGTI